MGSDRLAHSSVAERCAHGADARIRTPPELHSRWEPTADRPDPIAVLEEQSPTRDRDLVAARYARMMISPFTFYCGGARIMAGDLAATPTAGLMAQLCGDAHLSNFGVFAAPEGHPVFDFCDFDETLPGPFEYDIKRLATSVSVAARHNGLSDDGAAGSPQARSTPIAPPWPSSPGWGCWKCGTPGSRTAKSPRLCRTSPAMALGAAERRAGKDCQQGPERLRIRWRAAGR